MLHDYLHLVNWAALGAAGALDFLIDFAVHGPEGAVCDGN